MVRALLLVIGCLGWLVAGAREARAETLVLVEVPAPIEAALRSSLSPWGVDIVVVAPAPATYDPRRLAIEREASFVAWRRGDELVLYDVTAAAEERRPVTGDPDDAEAAAVALSIKTWMGLGPPPGGELLCGLDDCPAPPPRTRPWLVEIFTGLRGDLADLGGASFRYGLGAGHRRGRYEAGLRVDLGVDRGGPGFGEDGAWAVTGAGAWARAALEVRPAFTIVPGVGVGLVHTSFNAPRTAPGAHAEAASTTGFGLDVEVGARWQRGRVSAGGRLGLTAVPRTQVLRSRALEEAVDAHVEPWFLASMSVGI